MAVDGREGGPSPRPILQPPCRFTDADGHETPLWPTLSYSVCTYIVPLMETYPRFHRGSIPTRARTSGSTTYHKRREDQSMNMNHTIKQTWPRNRRMATKSPHSHDGRGRSTKFEHTLRTCGRSCRPLCHPGLPRYIPFADRIYFFTTSSWKLPQQGPDLTLLRRPALLRLAERHMYRLLSGRPPGSKVRVLVGARRNFDLFQTGMRLSTQFTELSDKPTSDGPSVGHGETSCSNLLGDSCPLSASVEFFFSPRPNVPWNVDGSPAKGMIEPINLKIISSEQD